MERNFIGSLLAWAMLCISPVAAQTVADARNAAVGSSVTGSGIVTSGPSLGNVRYLQDGTGGIAVFPGSGSAPGFTVQPGDDLTLTGTLTNYNGLLEITPITAFTVNSSGNALPAPVLITPNGLGEPVEARIVKVENVYFNGTGNFSAGTISIQAGTETANVYLRTGHPLVGTPIPTGPVDLTGIASQFDPSVPYTSGYQLLPREAADITPHGSISIIPPVAQTDLNTGGFNLNWDTNLPGSTEAFYGTTPDLGQHASDVAFGTSHALQLSGLLPATFYYAQAFSVDNGDTAFSVTGLYSTASTSSGTIAVYFTKSVDTGVSSGTNAVGLFGATDDTIKACIDRVQSTLDIAMYNTNSTLIVAAVNAAKARGVQVRWIAEGSNANTALGGLDASIPVLYRTDGLGSGMHNKFFIADVDDPQHAVVMGGSCNWTTQSFFEDYNNIVFVQDQALARCYTVEFNEMWGGGGPLPVAALSRFGPAKTDNTPHLFNVGGRLVESYFSPTDNVRGRIVQLLDLAQTSVHLALYVFTDNDLGDAVLNAYQRPGMVVQGDVEDVNSTGSEYNYLLGQGIDLHSHLDEPGLLHHKYAILDEGASGDPLVITGSHNWTASASSVNDENTLVIHDGTVANLFYQEWYARHYGATAIEEPVAASDLIAWPVPAQEVLHVRPQMEGSALIQLTDATGREVFQQDAVGTTSIPLHGFAPGIYALTCVQQGLRSQRTVLISR